MPKLIDFKNSRSFQIVNKTETKAEILLYASIGESMWGDSISAKQFADELAKLPKSVKEIDLRVNSPGGSVFDGVAIYERLKQHSAKVTAYVDGYAASIASVIIMAADEIIISEGGFVMIHKPMAGVWGNSFEMDRMITVLDKIEQQMISIYAKKTKKSRTEIEKDLGAETWYTAEEAIANGFATKMYEAKDKLALAASMSDQVNGCPWIKAAPKAQSANDAIRAKISGLNGDIKNFINKK